MKRKFRASFHQSTKFPTSIDRQTQLYGTFAPMWNWFQNKSPTHTFAVDCETWHCKWAAPCYFNGASPTGSLRWGYCLQWHLACEGLYGDQAFKIDFCVFRKCEEIAEHTLNAIKQKFACDQCQSYGWQINETLCTGHVRYSEMATKININLLRPSDAYMRQ